MYPKTLVTSLLTAALLFISAPGRTELTPLSISMEGYP
jgi:hypothetical protein